MRQLLFIISTLRTSRLLRLTKKARKGPPRGHSILSNEDSFQELPRSPLALSQLLNTHHLPPCLPTFPSTPHRYCDSFENWSISSMNYIYVSLSFLRTKKGARLNCMTCHLCKEEGENLYTIFKLSLKTICVYRKDHLELLTRLQLVAMLPSMTRPELL